MRKSQYNRRDVLSHSDCSDAEDLGIKTNNDYAKNYDNWRKKEELNKLKTKYGDVPAYLDSDQSGETSSSDDDEEAVEVTTEIEKSFFKTLSFLKNKDPKIYDNNIKFFNEENEAVDKTKTKKGKNVPVTIKDYERIMLLDGKIVNGNEKNSTSNEKKLLSAIGNDHSDDGDEELFKLRTKTKEEEQQEELDYRKWLAGQVDNTRDTEAESDLKPLKDYWSDPKLDANEKFLRDYILNKRYLSNEDDNYIPTYDEIVHDSDDGLSDDEKAIENQEEFEYKFNFRFEEPDQEFIKRYPRTIEKSLRKTDDRRKVKRAETKLRKQKEKEERMSDIKKLQELKRKEIEEKLEKIKEVTGDFGMEFQDDDIEGDFDPDAHDMRMQQLFDEEFYQKAEDDQKPEFPDIDEELEIEKWDDWDEDNAANKISSTDKVRVNSMNNLHCEDDNFVMDADYDPTADESSKEKTKRNKKGKRKSKVAEALEIPKPRYDPNNKNCEKYFDEYYKLDCEDIIGDIPCRFKYREVIPNDFGLSVQEILLAKDRELNRWCSLKKAVQYRPEHVEKYEQHAYSQKGKNVMLKKKILPSLFENEAENKRDNEIHNQAKHDEYQEQQTHKTLNKKIELSASDKQNSSHNRNEVMNDEAISTIEANNAATNTGNKTESSARKKKNKKINLQIQAKASQFNGIGAKPHQSQEQEQKMHKTSSNDERSLSHHGKKAEKNEHASSNDEKTAATSLESDAKKESKVKRKKNKKIKLQTQTKGGQSEVIYNYKDTGANPSQSQKQGQQQEMHRAPNRKRKLSVCLYDKQNSSHNGKKAKEDEISSAKHEKKAAASLENNSKTGRKAKKKNDKTTKSHTPTQESQSKPMEGFAGVLNTKKQNKNKSHISVNKSTATKSTKRSKLKKHYKPDIAKTKYVDIEISDERLAAYGLNPKKFKNKLKYGKSKVSN